MPLFKSLSTPFVALLLSLLVSSLYAQDSLPNFYAKERNGYAIIGWYNPFKDISELIIQRSTDSLSGFRSIMTMPDPNSVYNGFVYRKENAANFYYRIFYVRPGSRYTFTQSMKPRPYIADDPPISKPSPTLDQPTTSPSITPITPIQVDSILKSNPKIDSIFKVNPEQAMKIIRSMDESLQPISKINTPSTEGIFDPSAFIFIDTDGNLVIALPEVQKKKYSLIVYLEDGTRLFEMKNIREPHLLIDKSNFYKSGWFKYDLLESGKLKSRNRFYIPTEVR